MNRDCIVLTSDRMAKIAIIETGGKQYLVTQDSVITVEKLIVPVPASAPTAAEAKAGKKATAGAAKITFDKVLLTDDGNETKVGSPYVEGAKVSAELIEQGKADKVTVIRYRQKSRYFKKRGHRQPYTKVRITQV